MTNEKLRQFLASRDACPAFMDWLGKRDSAQMWAECRRPDWLIWWAGQAVSRQELVLAACDCAETALRYVSEVEDRPRRAIETARRWATGEATVEEVDAARAAAISAYINAGYAASFAALTAYATPAPFAAHSAAVAAKEAGVPLISALWQLLSCLFTKEQYQQLIRYTRALALKAAGAHVLL